MVKYRVYAHYGKGDNDHFGFNKLSDAKKMAKRIRKHSSCKGVSIHRVKGKR